MKYLVVDIGNTGCHFGLFDGRRLRRSWRIPTEKEISIGEKIGYDVLIVGSVVPAKLREFKRKKFRTEKFIVTHRDIQKLGIKILYKPPEGVGIDRLANAVTVKEEYRVPAVIIDFGTAITIDCVSCNLEYLGGVILPGVDIIRYGLNQRTALLPLVRCGVKKKVLAQNTKDAIKSGLYFGVIGMVEDLLHRLKEELSWDSPFIIATGGYAGLYKKYFSNIDEYLTIKGLRWVYERSRED